MNICNFCLDKNQPAILLSNLKFRFNGKDVTSNEVLAIYKTDLLKELLSYKEAKICSSCSQKLRDSYAFLQQIVESQHQLNKKRVETLASPPPAQQLSNTPSLPKFILPKPADANSKPVCSQNTTEIKEESKEKRLVKPKRQYKCSECTESFLNIHDRNIHKDKLHAQPNKTVPTTAAGGTASLDEALCDYCFTLFASHDILKEHLLEHPDKKYLCKQCNRKFVKKGFLKQHLMKKHNINDHMLYYCSLCLPEFSVYQTKAILLEHFQSHDFVVTEEFLDETFFNSFDLENLDLNLFNDILNFNPNESQEGQSAERPTDQQEQQQQQININILQSQIYECPKCHATLSNMKDLFQHLSREHEMMVLNCNICEASFKDNQSLNAHKLLEHANDMNSKANCLNLNCNECQKSFKSYSAWLYHKKAKIHRSDTNSCHKCPYCMKNFSADFNLKKHIRLMHSSGTQSTCALCDKQFNNMDHLRKHVLSCHDAYRKFICHYCGKSFTQAGHLKQHLAIHTIGKSHLCSLCDKKFWRKIDLVKHIQGIHQISEGAARNLVLQQEKKETKQKQLEIERMCNKITKNKKTAAEMDAKMEIDSEKPVENEPGNLLDFPKKMQIDNMPIPPP